MEDKMDQNTPIQPEVGKTPLQEIKSEFVEPQLIELGNLRDCTGMPMSDNDQ